MMTATGENGSRGRVASQERYHLTWMGNRTKENGCLRLLLIIIRLREQKERYWERVAAFFNEELQYYNMKMYTRYQDMCNYLSSLGCKPPESCST